MFSNELVMKLVSKKSELKAILEPLRAAGKQIGFVPTMGALHQGHLSLVTRAQKKNDVVVVSVFVNPTQFDNQEDLVKYPKTLAADQAMLEQIGCDVLFVPTVAEMYPEQVSAESFDFDGLEFEMEGKFRTGHFDGVGTVVKRLFELVEPHTAYFGKKDFQQYKIIKKLVKKYDLPVKVKGRPIFRESDGLAMSSRNTRLTEAHRDAAPMIFKILKKAKKKFGQKSIEELTQWVEKQFKKEPLLDLEYFTIADEKTLKTPNEISPSAKYRAFIAVFAGDIRLIDNIGLN